MSNLVYCFELIDVFLDEAFVEFENSGLLT